MPEKRDFVYGEKVQGKLVLDLKKPKKARKLKVKVCATITNRSRNISTGRSQTTTTTAYEFEQELSGEKEYPAIKQEYSFELPLPSQPVVSKEPEGAMGGVLKGVALLAGASQTVK